MTIKTKTSQSNGGKQIVKRVLMLSAVLLTAVFGLALLVPGPIQKSSYMGAEYCGSCHQQEYLSWRQSPHSRAQDVLADVDKNNLACLSCHATGVTEANQPFFKGVQCESCHGAGQYYASLHVKKDPVLSKLLFMQKPDEASCLHCHSSAANLWSPHQSMKKIDHWSKPFHGGELLKKVQ